MQSFESEQVEEKVRDLMSAVTAFRSQLAALNVPSNAKPHIVLRCKTEELKAIFASEAPVLQSLVKASQVDILGPSD